MNHCKVLDSLDLIFIDLEEDISDWIHTGNVGKLEELVLNGYADLLLGRTREVDDADTVNFLDLLPQYQVIIIEENCNAKISEEAI